MSNRFNYRCPKSGSPDQIEICALVSVRLTGNGPEIAADVKDIDGSCWSSENAASCDACGHQGAAKDFASWPAGVVSLNDYRRRR